MSTWINSFQKMSSATKTFYLVNLIFWVPLVLTTLYCYGRLDYVRSYKTETVKSTSLNKH